VQLKTVLDRYSRGDTLALDGNADRDSTLILATALYTVTAGLRDIHNVLHEINQNSAPPPPAPHYPDQRQHESLQAQITRLNEWLEEYAPAQYAAPGDTADAVLAVLAQEGDEICGLREQLAQMDVDNAALTAQLAQANTDAEKLVLAIAAIQGLQSENAALPAKEGRS
jgi:hypothetical protein